MSYLDNAGLTHFWGKIKAKLNGKSDVGHGHTEYLTQAQVEALLANYPTKTELLDDYLGGYKVRVANDSGKTGYITVKKG